MTITPEKLTDLSRDIAPGNAHTVLFQASVATEVSEALAWAAERIKQLEVKRTGMPDEVFADLVSQAEAVAP